jgi:tetratricopeptide (TPR) repeat protein
MQTLLEKPTTKDTYQRAVAFYNKGKFDNAEQWCRKAIAENPGHYEAYNILGAIANKKGKSGEAFAYFKKVIAINPNYADAYNNLGFICNENKSYDEAILFLNKAIELYPSYSEAYENLANALQNKGLTDVAVEHYKYAISFNPQCFSAYLSMCHIFVEQGKIHEGLECCKRAIAVGGGSVPSEVHLVLANYVLYTEGVAAWRDVIVSSLQKINFPASQKGSMLTSLAVIDWILDNPAKCLEYLDEAKKIISQYPNQPNFKNSLAYNNFLRSLILWYKDNPTNNTSSDNTLHFIGDSHCITYANKTINLGHELYNCKTHFIKGCKIWHLVKDGNNEYKVAFEREISSLPEGSLVVMNFGEIDCRYDEGLFGRYIKYATNLEDEVNSLLDKYFEVIINLIKKQKIVPIVWGIPAPHKNLCDEYVHPAHKEKFIQFIRYFNTQMHLRALKCSVNFVDNYKITTDKDGISNDDTHLDWHHLKPDIFQKAIGNLK